jgi:tetratricopeptide (TPR) repeat protein
VADPALSRNQCLFEVRDGAAWVTDLASANGTAVNGEELGTTSRKLAVGDRIQAGDCELEVVGGDAEILLSDPAAVSAEAGGEVDLGFAREESGMAADGEAAASRPASSPMRMILWLVLVLVLGGSAAAILLLPRESSSIPGISARPLAPAKLWSVAYEKVEASSGGICRYAIEIDAEGNMKAELDDVPDSNRHVRKSALLPERAKAELDRIFSSSDLYKLDKDYAGVARPGELARYSLRVVRGKSSFACVVENAPEPPAFKEVRMALETFSQNELGIWAIHYSAEKLTQLSREAWQSADAKWEERDVNYGNLAAALKLYDEAATYLETVNPKPPCAEEAHNGLERAEAELDKRYRDQRFLADRAINLQRWDEAQKELGILLEMVPERGDDRHREATAKLIDVEKRMKKGGK